MKRQGILHAELAAALAGLRHADLFVVSDAGLPVTPTVPVIDLAAVYGIPEFAHVLRAILREVVVEEAWVATEMRVLNPAQQDRLETMLPAAPHSLTHDDLKRRAREARFVVRTGDATTYSNVLLRAGVPFA